MLDDKAEAKQFRYDMIECRKAIEEAEDVLKESGLTNDTLITAIIYSVDWEKVTDNFKLLTEEELCEKHNVMYKNGGLCDICMDEQEAADE